MNTIKETMSAQNASLDALLDKLSQLPKEDLLEVHRFVEYLTFRASSRKRTRHKNKKGQHPGFGMWAKKLEGMDSAEYALVLRQRAARRAHARMLD